MAPYKVILDGKAANLDLLEMPDSSRKQVIRAIHERLTVDPAGLGKPLTGDFKGLYRLRVGDWRIIYKIDGEHVIIRNIRLRRDVYKRR